ncbi:MAG TPA: polysaccharide biosynthesis/export family protein [Spirochaetota bacterium]|nr:polysaccharide biosynthesis/export family protein [Spirochaetota bacterium]HPR49607.1 polysaccharide biosynthesis/export family protein [Spirochaetota bacterium]
MKKIIISVIFFIMLGPVVYSEEYTVGIGDILEVSILQPDHITNSVTVTPGGEISVPFLGTVQVKGKTITEVQRTIQYRLAQGYLKYPVVTVSLIESRSRNYTISGEVNTPGNYQLQENTTVLKAIAVAGGFTRFGSKSRVKILRPRKDRPGYREIKVDLKAVIDGDAKADILIEPGDIIVVSEGFF